jgi:hypothetical protein
MLRVDHGITKESELLFQQKTGHRLPPTCPYRLSDALGRGMCAVSGAKGIIDEEPRPVTDLLRPLRVISGVFGAEAGVLEKEDISTLHPLNRFTCEGAGGLGAKTHGRPESPLELSGHPTEGKRLVQSPLGSAQMRQQDRLRPHVDEILDRRQGSDETRVVDDFAILIEREVVIDPNDHDFVGKGLWRTACERLLGHPGLLQPFADVDRQVHDPL